MWTLWSFCCFHQYSSHCPFSFCAMEPNAHDSPEPWRIEGLRSLEGPKHTISISPYIFVVLNEANMFETSKKLRVSSQRYHPGFRFFPDDFWFCCGICNFMDSPALKSRLWRVAVAAVHIVATSFCLQSSSLEAGNVLIPIGRWWLFAEFIDSRQTWFVLVVSNSRICGSDMWGTDPKTCTADGGRTTQKRALVLWVFPTEWRIHKGFDDSSSFYVIWVSANQPINQKVFQEVAFLNSEDRGHLIVWRWIALKPSTVYPFLNLRPHCNEHSLRRLQTLNNGWNNFGFLPVSIPILRLLLAVPVNVHLQHRRCIALYKCMWLTWIRLLLSCQT